MAELTATAPLNPTQLQQLELRLEQILLRRFGELTEQQLLTLLDLKPLTTIQDSQFALFQRHFVLYHLLYRLAERWALSSTAYLDIGLAQIKIAPWQDNLPLQIDSKAAYYADWQNYWRMTPVTLSKRLASFWQFYQQRHSISSTSTIQLNDDEALQLLQLEWPCSLNDLKKAFRRLSLKHHPDRGGDKTTFVRISLAYQKILQRL